MFKNKFFFIVFEGIEGSGKSYQSKKLYQSLKKKGLNVLLTREPGGSPSAEKIRNLILTDYFSKNIKQQFDKYTDTLLYLAARNEHIINKILPAKKNKKIVICDRFIDSTISYQVYGKGVNKKFIDFIHKYILKNIKPDLTIILKVKISKAFKRLNQRKKKNRYDKFSKNFYLKAQKGFLNLAYKNNKKTYIFDNSVDGHKLEKNIKDLILKKLKING
mgnify:FL=1|tara:strand:+ start:239 stop:892 length:654 start_codon:yes stop_codon:yes gene_type:complete